jgi:hypothetical protein
MLSGVSFLRTEVRQQRTDGKKLEDEALNLNAVLCHRFSDT